MSKKILYCLHPNPKYVSNEKARTAANKDEPQNHWRSVGVGFDNKDGSVNVFLHNQPGVSFQLRNEPEDPDAGHDAAE